MAQTEAKNCLIVPAGIIVKYNGSAVQLSQDITVKIENIDSFLDRHIVLELDRTEVDL